MTTQIFGDRWQVVEPLAEGGQAHTFKVIDLKGSAATQYVLKRLKNLNRLERFRREVAAVRDLGHANIVQLIDFDLEATKPYLVTEYCSGGSLDRAAPFWRDSPLKALALFQQICAGVAYAHAQTPPIIHRDLKPPNIFLRTPTGAAVVGDFGICYTEDDGTRLTLTDEAAGPRLYMAPELEDGRLEDISPASDVYSLGKVLYWLLSPRGEIFSREKHREPKWDLKGRNDDSLLGWDNIYMEHINQLLDSMLVPDPQQRRTVHTAAILARQAARLIQREFQLLLKKSHDHATTADRDYTS